METEVYIDIETDGLDPTVIWCVGVLLGKNERGNSRLFRDPVEFANFVESYAGATFYAHNGISFDFPVLEQLWAIDFSEVTLRDTLVLSRLSNPSREKPEGMVENKPHSLEAWGIRLGFPKGDFEDWSRYTEDMGLYCMRDTDLLKRIHTYLKGDMDGFTEQSIELEHQVATIIDQQVKKGWLLDQREAYMLLAELRERSVDLEDEVHERFKPRVKFVKQVVPKTKNDGSTSVVGLKFLGEHCLSLVGGPFSRIDFPSFNLGSRQQIASYLQYFGWEPTVFTPSGQAQVDETTLEGVDIPEAQMIAEYLMVGKRVAMVQSWCDAADEESDGRVRGYVNSNGAVTGRMTHSDPNVAQVPASYSPYGPQCRSCWTVRQGYKLVGVDASGLELRMLAHYMNDPEFTRAVCEGRQEDGTDIHSVNQRAAGLATRDQAKTFIYAFLYGAGDAKIGSIVGGTAKDGARLKAKFLSATPALRSLRERVEVAARRGWLKGLDGRRIRVRSTYAALNTLLQGAGAIIMKQALVIQMDKVAQEGLDGAPVGNIHDETQSEVYEGHSETYGRLAVEAIVEAGVHFNLRCPLAAEAKIGDNWSQTH